MSNDVEKLRRDNNRLNETWAAQRGDYEKVLAENRELLAQNARLREALDQAAACMRRPGHPNIRPAIELAIEALSETPAASTEGKQDA